MNWKQFLTKQILKESSFTNTVTISCDGRVWLPRTFDNRNDLMDLYAVIEKAGRWRNFEGETFDYWDEERIHDTTNSSFTAWLFCLDGKGYEERCKMIAAWIKEGK